MAKAIKAQRITWNEIEKTTEKLAEKIHKDGFHPDVIIAILRGGVTPARILSDIFNQKNF